jgi:hypothetical protein
VFINNTGNRLSAIANRMLGPGLVAGGYRHPTFAACRLPIAPSPIAHGDVQ